MKTSSDKMVPVLIQLPNTPDTARLAGEISINATPAEIIEKFNIPTGNNNINIVGIKLQNKTGRKNPPTWRVVVLEDTNWGAVLHDTAEEPTQPRVEAVTPQQQTNILTLDALISAALLARAKSPLGGRTVVHHCEQDREYITCTRAMLDTDTDHPEDGAVFLVCIN